MPAGRSELSETAAKVIVGLGGTGLSCARFLAAKNEKFIVVDSRDQPPALAEFKALFPEVSCHLGGFPAKLLLAAEELIVSPGVDLATKEIAAAIAANVKVSGDIDLFSREVSSPILAVTGSNGKSTVVALLADICKRGGVSYGLGGNLDGENFKPALDLLQEPKKEVYILELSSFQLETTSRLGAEVAVILNLSADHMDRYDSLTSYLTAKQKIFAGARQIVVNQDDPASAAPAASTASLWKYGIKPGHAASGDNLRTFGLLEQANEQFLAFQSKPLIASKDLKMVGQHNISNILAAMAIATAAGIDMDKVLSAVKNFSGLPHRCQWIAQVDGVDYYNDSKGTNVGATLAALDGLGQRVEGSIILIAGGIGKGADFSSLAAVVNKVCKHLILMGQDAKLMASELAGGVPIEFVASLEQGVLSATAIARPGDAVLLSPACASFDMFKNFQERGQVFMQAVEALQ